MQHSRAVFFALFLAESAYVLWFRDSLGGDRLMEFISDSVQGTQPPAFQLARGLWGILPAALCSIFLLRQNPKARLFGWAAVVAGLVVPGPALALYLATFGVPDAQREGFPPRWYYRFFDSKYHGWLLANLALLGFLPLCLPAEATVHGFGSNPFELAVLVDGFTLTCCLYLCVALDARARGFALSPWHLIPWAGQIAYLCQRPRARLAEDLYGQ